MKSIKIGVFFSLIAIGGCNISEEQEQVLPTCKNVVHAPQEFLDYWFVPKGSWWVYKLKGSVPAVYDTVRLTGMHKKYYLEPEADTIAPKCEMLYLYDIVHSNQDYFSHPLTTAKRIETLKGYKSQTGKWIIENGIVFSFPFNLGENPDLCFYDTSTFVLPNFIFSNSVSLTCQYYDPELADYYTFKICFSKGVGIVYRRFRNGDEWELENYHINQ